MLKTIVQIIGAVLCIGGALTGFIHMVIINPVMERRSLKKGEWLCEDPLYFPLAVCAGFIGVAILIACS